MRHMHVLYYYSMLNEVADESNLPQFLRIYCNVHCPEYIGDIQRVESTGTEQLPNTDIIQTGLSWIYSAKQKEKHGVYIYMACGKVIDIEAFVVLWCNFDDTRCSYAIRKISDEDKERRLSTERKEQFAIIKETIDRAREYIDYFEL